MEKYKLIETYPGSPKLGYIFNPDTIGDEKTTHAIYTLYAFPNLVKNQPKYWEKVVEKDYEILSIINNSCKEKQYILGDIAKKNYEGYFMVLNKNCVYRTRFDIVTFNLTTGWDIYSVKRLSDGEIFTVDDYINEQREKSKILYFEIRENNELAIRIEHQVTKGSSTIFMWSNFQHIKKPLFTTEDGVDIFEGDMYWKNNGWLNVFSTIAGKSKPYCLNDKPFSTKEAAEEYILLNERCLSYGDVQEYLKVRDVNKVLELVKSKL